MFVGELGRLWGVGKDIHYMECIIQYQLLGMYISLRLLKTASQVAVLVSDLPSPSVVV